MFMQAELLEEMTGLRKFAMRLTGNVQDAEDLLQSTMLRAIEKKHLFEDGTDLFKWSSKIMYNLFVSNYRRKVKFETQYDPESYIQAQSVEATQDSHMELYKVMQVMKELSADHQEILVLVCVKGLSYDEVAKSLQISVGTVRSRLSRARENLQMRMELPDIEHRTKRNFGPLPAHRERNRVAA